MKNLSLRTAAAGCGGKLNAKPEVLDQELKGVVIDSRKAEPGFLFIAAKGERVDGHDFIAGVMEKGAAGVVCEKRPEDPGIPYILVEDSYQALRDIAAFYREQLPVKVIGITGSVGKTSTKEFVASVLARKLSVHKTEGNFNNEIGLPLTVLQIREEHEAAVVEMGISHFGEMHRLSEIAKPDVCVLTNIGQSHLEFLGTREGILKAKSEIFDFAAPGASVCINGDDDMLAGIRDVKGKRPIRFGLDTSNDIYADSIVNQGLFGSRATIHTPQSGFEVSVPLPGEHMLYNALAATAVGKLFGLTNEQIAEGIAQVKPVGGRSHIIRGGEYTVIDDCYNANPVSMEAALDLLNTALTRRVAILGDMFELGENSDALHERVGKYAVEQGTDLIVCVGNEAKHMYEAGEELRRKKGGRSQLRYFPTKEELHLCLPGLLKKGDTVLVKASNGMGFGSIVESLRDTR